MGEGRQNGGVRKQEGGRIGDAGEEVGWMREGGAVEGEGSARFGQAGGGAELDEMQGRGGGWGGRMRGAVYQVQRRPMHVFYAWFS